MNKMLDYIFVLHLILLEFSVSLPFSMAATWFSLVLSQNTTI